MARLTSKDLICFPGKEDKWVPMYQDMDGVGAPDRHSPGEVERESVCTGHGQSGQPAWQRQHLNVKPKGR